MNRAEIVNELERIRALLQVVPATVDLTEARSALEALGETIRTGDLFDPDGCPFEPGSVRLTGLQSRGASSAEKPKSRAKAKAKSKSRHPIRAARDAQHATAEARSMTSSTAAPLTGRIAAMVRGGVPAEEIVRLYRIKAEHADAFVAAYILPVRQELSAVEPAGADDVSAVMHCPTPL